MVAVPALTMSATAAAPAFLGAQLKFMDVSPGVFASYSSYDPMVKTQIVTNLFGHPSHLMETRENARINNRYLIEDNAQAIGAMEAGKHAGTFGDIGVFSLNVHKHIQCGEGGVCLTDNHTLAERMRMARNHGELAGYPAGLNLRMTEVEAAIAYVQMVRLDSILAERIEQAEQLTDMVAGNWGILPPLVRTGFKHVYYVWSLLIYKDREWFVKAMNAEGFPLKAGYVEPLYRLKAFSGYEGTAPEAERLHDSTLCIFENCAFDPTTQQMKQIREAFVKVGEEYAKRVSKAA